MHWFADYWWVILILLVGIIINAIKDMNKIDPKQFLKISGSCLHIVILMINGMMKMIGLNKIKTRRMRISR